MHIDVPKFSISGNEPSQLLGDGSAVEQHTEPAIQREQTQAVVPDPEGVSSENNAVKKPTENIVNGEIINPGPMIPTMYVPNMANTPAQPYSNQMVGQSDPLQPALHPGVCSPGTKSSSG